MYVCLRNVSWVCLSTYETGEKSEKKRDPFHVFYRKLQYTHSDESPYKNEFGFSFFFVLLHIHTHINTIFVIIVVIIVVVVVSLSWLWIVYVFILMKQEAAAQLWRKGMNACAKRGHTRNQLKRLVLIRTIRAHTMYAISKCACKNNICKKGLFLFYHRIRRAQEKQMNAHKLRCGRASR